MPTLYIIGGPNGSGKSTLSKIIGEIRDLVVINPDELIFQWKAEGVTNSQSLLELLKIEIEQLFDTKQSFIFESNLHDFQSYEIVIQAKTIRYRTELLFISVDNLDLLKNRVRIRVDNGGHHVPDNIIEFRYESGMNLLPSHIKYFDRIELIDSKHTISEIQYIIRKSNTKKLVKNPSKWSQNIVERCKKDR